MNRADHPVRQPLVGRQRPLVVALWAGLALAGGLATLAVVLPGQPGELAGRAFLAAVIAIPPLRVLWLTVRWLNRRDVRFAMVGLGLISVAAAATASALI